MIFQVTATLLSPAQRDYSLDFITDELHSTLKHLKSGTHWWQSRQSTKWQQSQLLTLSPIPSTLSAIPSTLSPICRRNLRLCYWFVAVDIVAKVEHVQLGRLCRKWVIYVAQMWKVFSTLSPVCTEPKRQSRLCRIQLCHQCLPGYRRTAPMADTI